MITITKYNIQSGQIMTVIDLGNPDDADLQCSPGEAWLHGKGDPATQMVEGGRLVPRPSKVVEAEAIENATRLLRARRNRALAASDWTQLPDAALSAGAAAAWAQYRQALRDLMAADVDPRTVTFPTPPK